MQRHNKGVKDYLTHHKIHTNSHSRSGNVKDRSSEEQRIDRKSSTGKTNPSATSNRLSQLDSPISRPNSKVSSTIRKHCDSEPLRLNSSKNEKGATPNRKRILKKPTYVVRNPNLSNLPQELLLKIFGFLNASDLLVICRVCKYWLNLTNDNVLWKKVHNNYVNSTSNGKPVKQNPKTRKPVAKSDESNPAFWKSKCVQQSVELRNKRVHAFLKKPKGFNGLIRKQDTETALTKLGTQWLLTFVDSDSHEFITKQSDVFVFPMSLCVRWYGVDLPSIKRIEKLIIYAANPVFFNENKEPLKDSACQRSLMYECPINQKELRKHVVLASDDTINIQSISPGIIIATHKADGEIAFVTSCFHNYKLLERCYNGTSSRPYIPALPKPPFDDIDTQRGLHSYTFCVELRNQRTSIWNNMFREVFCKKENIGSAKGKQERYARFDLIKEICNYEHSPIGKRLKFPWKTELFKGIIKDFSVLDVTLVDEHKSPMWTVSAAVNVLDPHSTDVTYDYDGDAFSIEYEDEGVGKIYMAMVWEPEINQYMIKQMYFELAVNYINHYFGTKY